MGDLLSVPSTNPSDTPNPIAMPSSQSPQTPQSESENSADDTKIPQPKTPLRDADPPPADKNETLRGQEKVNVEEGDRDGEERDEDDDEEEGEGECGFCLFMKGGGCRDSFIAWEKCIEAAEEKKEDIVEKCFEVTGALKKCMEAHPDYYGPILQAEKAAETEAVNQLEKEKEKEKEKEAAAAAASSSAKNSSEHNSAEELKEQSSDKS